LPGCSRHFLTIRLSAIGKLYHSTTGELLESTNFQVTSKEIGEAYLTATGSGDATSPMLTGMAKVMAEKVATRVADMIYPARIIAVTDRQVTINRGEGTGVAPGQVWTVFTLGKEMFDPDQPGVSLGREEVRAGKVKIVSVQPRTTRAEIVEGGQILEGALLRPEPAPAPAP